MISFIRPVTMALRAIIMAIQYHPPRFENPMKKALAAIGASLLLMQVVPAVAATIKIENKSSWEIHEIYFAPNSQEDWGDDHLGKQVLKPGMTLSLTGVNPGKWDVRLVDEDADECIVEGQKISASEKFVIEDEDLLSCQAGTDQ